MKARKDFR